MNEKELIQLIINQLPKSEDIIVGPGDDCAVVKIPDSGTIHNVLKVDTIVESIHFEPGTDPEKVGHKALARALSDFGAMGASPDSAMVSLSMEAPVDPQWVTGFYKGLASLAGKFNVKIVGGETTRAPSGKVIAVTVQGYCPKDKFTTRCSAMTGDALFVSGLLGGSLAGKHLDFTPRVEEGKWLTENFDIHAMMDVSDGLASDLQSMLTPEKLGADLLKSAIPISREAKTRFRERKSTKSPLEAAMTDGEDYELVFAVAPSQAVSLKDAWKAQFPDLPISCIGKTSKQPGIRMQSEQGFELMRQKGFDHFDSLNQN